jgi:hypothetical protein
VNCLFSECRRFRYTLTREWDASLSKVAFIGLNPSTADEMQDDPTIRRCIGFAKTWGYGGLLMLNIFAFRATKPADMWKAWKAGVDIIGGSRNWTEDLQIYALEHKCARVIAAWGTHGGSRGTSVMLNWQHPELECLGLNANGSPKHPLYLKGDLVPMSYTVRTSSVLPSARIAPEIPSILDV